MGEVVIFPGREPAAPGAGSPEHRAALESVLERMLDAADHIVRQLDAMDGDADLEPEPVEATGDEEPSLGAPAGGESQMPWAAGGSLDLEAALARLGRACRERRSTEGA